MKLLRNLFVSCACRMLALSAMIVALSGCATTGDGAMMNAEGTGVTNAVARIDSDTIRVGEQLTIELLDIGTPTKIEQTVGEDKTITLPLLPDRIPAAGKKVNELQDDIHDRYVPRYYKRMTVNIKRENRYFFVGGQVKNPSQRVYTGDMTLIRAIKSAGDFTDYADRRHVKILRSNGIQETVDAKAAIKNPKKDVPIYPGDTIDVPLRLY